VNETIAMLARLFAPALMASEPVMNPLNALAQPSMFDKGGPLMYPILLASIVGVASAIYCLFVLRRKSVMTPALLDLADRLAPGDDIAAAEALCRREGGPFGEVIRMAIRTRDLGVAEAERLVEGAGRRAAHELSRGILALEVVAGIAPLLGLFGTVLGMYQLLGEISAVGVIKDIGMISGGIGQALITTIAGLTVGIPALVAHVYFTRRADDVALAMEERAAGLMARLRRSGE